MDWISKSHNGLHSQANQTYNYLDDSVLARIGLNIRPYIQTEYSPKLNMLNTSYEAWLNSSLRTPVHVANLKTAEKEFIPFYRQFYSGFIRNNPLVTDTDLILMGMPTRPKKSHTLKPIPRTIPLSHIKLPSPGIIDLHYRDSGSSTSRKKPFGVHCVEIRWAILDERPSDLSDLIHTTVDTATPFRFEFDHKYRGHKLYYALRWENTRGEKGPWSNIENAIIP